MFAHPYKTHLNLLIFGSIWSPSLTETPLKPANQFLFQHDKSLISVWFVYSHNCRSLLQNRPRSGNRVLRRFGMSRSSVSKCCVSPQEHLNYVTEISQDELFILDPELVTKETVGTSPGMPGAMETVGGCSDSTDLFAFPACSSEPLPLCR